MLRRYLVCLASIRHHKVAFASLVISNSYNSVNIVAFSIRFSVGQPVHAIHDTSSSRQRQVSWQKRPNRKRTSTSHMHHGLRAFRYFMPMSFPGLDAIVLLKTKSQGHVRAINLCRRSAKCMQPHLAASFAWEPTGGRRNAASIVIERRFDDMIPRFVEGIRSQSFQQHAPYNYTMHPSRPRHPSSETSPRRPTTTCMWRTLLSRRSRSIARKPKHATVVQCYEHIF